MEYERIQKVQMGVLSPTKLRMKLLGTHNSRKKEGRNNSSKTSPSRIEDMEYAKNSLLSGHLNGEASCKSFKVGVSHHNVTDLEVSRVDLPGNGDIHHIQSTETRSYTRSSHSKEKADTSCVKFQNISKSGSHQVHLSDNLSMVHPVRPADGNNAYDSKQDNANISSFEFHRGERISQHPFSRNVPSKWNDAEKWIVNRQARHPNILRKSSSQKQGSRQVVSSWSRPSMVTAEQRHSVEKAADNRNNDYPAFQNELGMFSFFPYRSQSDLEMETQTIAFTDTSPALADFKGQPTSQNELNHKESFVEEKLEDEKAAVSTTQSVLMRDVGTEMTPIPSEEPSRTGTPLGALTPTRTPNSSMPSTPRRVAPEPAPVDTNIVCEADSQRKNGKIELSERELHVKTRKEIAALGVQLGKMNIASWATKELLPPPETLDAAEMVKKEYETRAAIWEEEEKSKHTARYKQEEVKIQAWESHQKAKLEAKMRKIEVQIEQERARAEKKVAEKLVVTRQRTEEKQAAAEARMKRQDARTAQQAKQIRETGRIPPSNILSCSCCLF